MESIFYAYEGGRGQKHHLQVILNGFLNVKINSQKWRPLKDYWGLKFCMGPYFIYTHAAQKERLNLRTFWKIGTA